MKKAYITLFIFLGLFLSNYSQGPQTQICLVTVDTSSTYNIIVWERASQTSSVPIDSIKIYREGILLPDSLIATVDYNALSEYHDTTANPNIKGWRYKISGVDANGVEGPLSAAHRTIHFSLWGQADSIRLRWTPYVGKTLNFYRCWADSTGSASWGLVNSTPTSADTSWWDNATPTNWSNLEYLVDVDWSYVCTSTLKQQSHNTTRSNRAIMAGSPSAEIKENPITNISLFPNPSVDRVTLMFSSTQLSELSISLINIEGKVIKTEPKIFVYGQNQYVFDLTNIPKGIYTIVLKNNYGIESKRFIKL